MSIIFDPFSGNLIDIGSVSGGSSIGGSISGSSANSALIIDSSNALQNLVLSNGQLVIGATGASPVAGTITGTSNQVVVTNGVNSITLSLPQSIATISSPTFAGLTLDSFSGPVKATAGVLSSAAISLTSEVSGVLPTANGGTGLNASSASNGQLLIGNGSGLSLATITGTSNQVTVTNGSGSITLSLPQSIATTSSPSFANLNLSPSGLLDVTSAGTLSIGTSNATIINIGNAGATVNIQGDTIYQNVTNLNVADKNIAVNVGGSAGSGANAGIHVEEGGSVTGHVEVTGSRLGWEFHPPGVVGIATLLPGSAGITIDQSSHNPVTLGTANGLSLSTQELSLGLSSASNTGALSNTDWNTFNGKQNALTIGNLTSSDITVTGGTGAIIGSGVSLTLPVVNADVGTFTFASITVNGKGQITAASSGSTPTVFQDGTFLIENSTDNTKKLAFDLGQVSTASTVSIVMADFPVNLAALKDENIFINADISGSKILAGSIDVVLVSDATGHIATSGTTTTEIGYVSGVTSSIQTQLDGKVSLGFDIAPTTWSGLTNNTSSQSITGLIINSSVSSFELLMNVSITATANTNTTFKMYGTKTGANWSINDLVIEYGGASITGIGFNITSAGQMQISIGNITGFSSGSVKFRMTTV